jgi:hypothetical protein
MSCPFAAVAGMKAPDHQVMAERLILAFSELPVGPRLRLCVIFTTGRNPRVGQFQVGPMFEVEAERPLGSGEASDSGRHWGPLKIACRRTGWPPGCWRGEIRVSQ